MNLVEFVKERAKEFRNKVFLREKKNSLTYQEFDQVTDRMAAGLQALGLEKGDHAAESIRDGWVHTGDLARQDEEGYFFIVGRKKDLRITGGYNVYPREVEEVLYTHPAVYEAAAIGVADEVKGEIPKACVTLKPGQAATGKEIVEFCKQNLAPYKVLRQVKIRSELPKSSTGKILHRELRKA